MRRQVVFAALLALIGLATADITITGEEDQEIRIGNATHLRHTANIRATQSGEASYTSSTPDGGVASVDIVIQKPAIVFTLEKIGYIPRFQFLVQDENCLLQQRVNDTAILQEQYDLLGRDANGIPTGPIFQPVEAAQAVPSAPPVLQLVNEVMLQPSALSSNDAEVREEIETAQQRRMTPWLKRGYTTAEKVAHVVMANSGDPLLENLAFSMQVGTVRGHHRKPLQFVAGFVGGVVGGFLYSALFGGGGDSGVDAALRAIQNQLNVQTTWDTNIQTWVNQAGRSFDLLYGEDQAMRDQLNDQVRINQIFNATLGTQITVTNILANEIVSGFSATAAAFNQTAVQNAETSRALLNLITQTNQQLINLAGATQQVDRQLGNVLALAYRWYQQFDMRTFITKAITTTSFSRPTDAIPTTPFTNGPGTPPLTDQVKITLKNLCNAPVVASVTMLYTTGSSPRVARQTVLDYICDQDFLMTNAPPFVDFKTLLYNIGPGSATQRCFHDGSAQQCTGSAYAKAWNCSCVIRRTEYACNMASSSAVWPYSFTSPYPADSLNKFENMVIAANAAGGSYSKLCAATTSDTPDSNTVTPASVSTFGHLSDYNGWYSDINSVCTTIKTGIAASGSGYRVRISSRYSKGFQDLIAGSDELCSYSNTLFMGQASLSAIGVGYSVYRFFALSFELAQKTIIPRLARTWIGVLTTGVTATISPISRVPDSNTTGLPTQCAQTQYVRLYDDEDDPAYNKLPVWILRPKTIRHQLTVTVTLPDGNTASPSNTSDFDAYNCANFSQTGTGSVCLVTDLQMTADYANYLPGGQPMLIAGWLARGTHRDPLARDLLFDIPDFKWGSPGDCDRVNVLQEGIGEGWEGVTDTSPMNITNWMSAYGRYWNPNCVETSPHLFMRAVGNDGQCNGFYDPRHLPTPDTPRYIRGGIDNHLCEIYRRFEVDYDPTTEEVRLTPRQFVLQATVKFPKGELVRTIDTSCPSVNISIDSGIATVTLTTLSTKPISVFYEITGDCPQAATVDSLTANNPFSLAVDPCGVQLFNVRRVDSTTWCYLNPFSLNVSQATGGDSTAGFSSKMYVNQALDGSVTTAHQIQSAVDDLDFDIAQVQSDATSTAAAAQRVNQLITDCQTSLQNAAVGISAGLPGFQQQIADQIAKLERRRQQLVNITVTQVTRNQQLQATQKVLAQSLQNGSGDALVAQKTLAVVVADNEITKQKVDDVIANECDNKEPPLIGPMLCNLKSDFSTNILRTLLVIGLVVLLICCLPRIMDCCNKAGGGRTGARVHAEQSETVPMARFTGADNDTDNDGDV